MERIIIIGGGIAGLTCLNALLDHGISATLFEGGTIGSPKMCGEFIAPPAMSLLKEWNITPIQSIEHVKFISHHKKLDIPLPSPAGAFSRQSAELQLAKRAKDKGGIIHENTPIQNIAPHRKNPPYLFQLNSGEMIEATHAFIATGKLMLSSQSIALPYYGIKTHLPAVIQPKTLLMYNEADAYFGLVPISEGTSNFACLAKKSAVQQAGSGQNYLKKLIEKNKDLQSICKEIDTTNLTLLESSLPDFNLKKRPNLTNIFWIGDALAGFPPAIGYGFAHSIHSALTAVEYFLKNNSNDYSKVSKKSAKPILYLGKVIHKILLNQTYSSLALPVLNAQPWISNLLLKKIGYTV